MTLKPTNPKDAWVFTVNRSGKPGWQDGKELEVGGVVHIYGCTRDARCFAFDTLSATGPRDVDCDCPCHNGETYEFPDEPILPVLQTRLEIWTLQTLAKLFLKYPDDPIWDELPVTVAHQIKHRSKWIEQS